MKTTIIHVNRQHIAFNAKMGEPILPTYIIREGSKSTYGYAVKIDGPSSLVDPREHKQLKCGARAWITTNSPVEITEPMTYQDTIKLKESI